MTVVDSHVHWWTLARGDYRWLTPKAGPLYRDFGPVDLAPLLRAEGVDRIVLVQAADTVAETRFLLSCAAARSEVAAVVGWADFDAADFSATIAAAARPETLKGMRPMLQDLDDDAWCAAEVRDGAFSALARAGVVFDALVRPRHLRHLLKRMERTPGLTVVVDHAAKPDVRSWEPGDSAFRAWRDDFRAVAKHPQARCKWSGLFSEAAPSAGAETLRPYADVVMETFGPERTMFGSDWPVLLAGAAYGDWLGLSRELFSGLSGAETDAVFGGTAARTYGFDAASGANTGRKA